MPAHERAEWTAWIFAIEELGADPCVDNFEQLVSARNKFLETSTPPPGSHQPRPSRLIPLVELWNAQAETLRESKARRSSS
ncbi:hypothetical protein [Actinocrinis sp.]|uniref:hypothetical protein n=1 Tax=Actinocrinis sp. TaxID=1920516 RepID=UPI002DDD71CE|nr:hypothetical protein [Actinocrinis sp.]